MHIVGGYKLSATKLVTYPVYLSDKPRSHKQVETEKNLSRGEYTGEMSKKTKAKVMDMLCGWYMSVLQAVREKKAANGQEKPYLTFCTTTLSAKQQHEDNEIKRIILNTFIINVQKQCGVKHYFWRAETQKNGNLHFHFILDKYIPARKIQYYWNLAQENLDYVSRFEKVFGHRQPPSTHIVKCDSLRKAASYISKYLSKSGESRKVKGRIWGCSDGLRGVTAMTVYDDSEFARLESTLKAYQNIRQFHDKFVHVYYLDSDALLKCKFQSIHSRLSAHYLQKFELLYSNSPPIDDFVPEKPVFIESISDTSQSSSINSNSKQKQKAGKQMFIQFN